MSLYALLRNNPRPTMHDIEECFDGNLCRCTGYRPILDAAKSFAIDHPTQAAAQVCSAVFVVFEAASYRVREFTNQPDVFELCANV